ncbi:MAG TPA: Coenzyme F420 hydrogenase/dehydrogenase, beta subunit C-terminal domain [Smithella sp.]|nr:Coenzyme F420 hydrogenase/dehydrogenase, beta subunit C-terminal domain [Smithella sp.]
MKSKVKAGTQGFLKKHVLEEGLCTGCGACVSLCPYQVIYHDRTVQLHQCDLEDGKCYAFCPRTKTDLAALRKLLFHQGDLTPEIGAVKGYYFSRSVDPRLRSVAQHGATVSALMELALSEGLIDSAIVSSRDGQFLQNGAVVKDLVDIRNNAKSRFTVSPTGAVFNQLLTRDSGNVGVVATPCQALALAKMRLNATNEYKTKINQLKLVVGLYCGWTLSMEKYTKLLLENNIALESVTGMDIPAGGNILELYTDDGTKSIPFDAVQSCIREACRYCMDSTAEFADVSVGSARFSGKWSDVRKWNQLIVRTEKGRELVELAVRRGVLDVREAPAENLKELKDAAVNKKNNALKNIIEKSGSRNNLLYLDQHDPVVLKYLKKKSLPKRR